MSSLESATFYRRTRPIDSLNGFASKLIATRKARQTRVD